MTEFDRALRGPAALVRDDLRRQADPGRDHRLLLRRPDRGPGRIRHPGRDHLGDAAGARLQAAEGSGALADRQHGPGCLRLDRDPDRHPRLADRAADRRPRLDGRPPDAVPGADRAADPGRRGRRQARRAPDLARGAGRRRHLRDRAVRLLELHLGRAHRHHRGARLDLRPGRLPARLEAVGAAAHRAHRRAAARRSPARRAHDPALERGVRLRDQSAERGHDPARSSRRSRPYIIIVVVFALAKLVDPIEKFLFEFCGRHRLRQRRRQDPERLRVAGPQRRRLRAARRRRRRRSRSRSGTRRARSS